MPPIPFVAPLSGEEPTIPRAFSIPPHQNSGIYTLIIVRLASGGRFYSPGVPHLVVALARLSS
jgi:hypothetical protein